MSKKISLGAGLALAAISAAVTMSITYVYAMNSFNEKVADVNERQAMYTKLSEIDQKVRQDYVGEIDEELLSDSICAGYVAGLGDAQAKYYSAQKYKEYESGLTGKSVGVGVVTVQDEDGNMEVVDVLPGSAAESSGIQKGDVIVSLDGKEIVRLTYGDAVNKLDGQAGTTVELGILRPSAEEGGASEQISLTVTRAEYTQRSLTVSTINGNVGYLAISQFSEGTDSQFNTELTKLLQSGVAGIVIDVRNNLGGDMEVMANILDTLLPAGNTVSLADSSGNVTVEYTSQANEIAVPISVIVNESTYGAAELFAADIQDYKKGLLVGTKTAGSGQKQDIISLSDGSAVLISVGEYLRISGESFNGAGIDVDVEKELDSDQAALLSRGQLLPSEDVQVQAAVAALIRQGVQVAEPPEEETEEAAESQPEETASSAEASSSAESNAGASSTAE